MLVLGDLGQGEGAGQGDLDGALGVGAQEPGVAHLHRMAAPDRPDHAGHLDGPARAPGDDGRIVEVDALERAVEAVGVALAPELAVAQDIEPGALHLADGHQRGGVLGLLEVRLGDAPDLAGAHPGRRHGAEPGAVDQPVGLDIAPHQGRRNER